MARLRTDWILFLTIVGLVCFGLVMVYSSSSATAVMRYGWQPYHFIVRQICWAIGSLVVMMYVKRMDYRLMNSPAFAFSGLAVVLGLLVAVYFVGAKHRWFGIPGIGAIQPSEFAKPAFVLFLAYFVSRRAHIINDRSTLRQGLLAVVVLTVLVLAADLGTALIPLLTALIVFWVAGLDWRYLIRIGAFGIVLVLIAIVHRPYRLARIVAYVDSEHTLLHKIDSSGRVERYLQGATRADPKYQARQSVIAVASGGPLGRGLTEGRQKILFLPDPHTDFIFATVGEELGLWGSGILLVGFLIILWRGARLFVLARDDFGKYLALGVTLTIVLQAFLNMSVVLDLAPTKGFPLPLISFGGSSLMSTLILLGMLLSVGEHEG